ncbi:hypothetical protein [Dyadobacter sp. CY347]|uniref:hypothetical protein n=1 Tax=Dyadobacter sp. CY347 TaxID=2909336 RepID=UPI001F4554A0|nr:hypothetical protein [Dyadobacter sp. CY347]MCF2487819.1 hypothetical protein [Dyadobacter sp. CY347]
MIHFDFNWSDPLNLIILALALALLPLQLWLILRGNVAGRFTSRHWVRIGLHVLLWLAVLAFIIQPYGLAKAKTVTGFIAGKDVPAMTANSLRDSINNLRKLVSSDFKSAGFDTLILAGQDFPVDVFEGILSAKKFPERIEWIPYFSTDKWQTLQWKGILRKGEMQVVQGSMNASGPKLLKVKYGSKTLDSIALNKGQNKFSLRFPVFSEGRTLVELALGDQVQDTLHFFARPSQKLTFQFILDSPDFESRALADWLGKSGHAVIYEATLSKNTKSQQTINKGQNPDVIITDAGNAGNAIIKKHLAAGKSILFMNMTKPADEIKAINVALGTRFNVRRISAEESVPVNPGLTALPFRFVPGNRYLISKTFPVAVEKNRGRVGVSLLSETFPLQLAGDSVAYQKVWDAVFAPVLPATADNMEIQAPLFEGVNASVKLNWLSNALNILRIGSDSIFLSHSLINQQSAGANFRPTETGWISSNDSLNIELFVEKQANMKDIYHTAMLTDFIKSYNSLQNRLKSEPDASRNDLNEVKQKLPDWMWFTLLMLCCLAVWIERKL